MSECERCVMTDTYEYQSLVLLFFQLFSEKTQETQAL